VLLAFEIHFAILEELEKKIKQGFRIKFGTSWSCHFAESTTMVIESGRQDTSGFCIQHDA
jgi:hypothetical protein